MGKNEFTILLPVSTAKKYVLFPSYSVCVLIHIQILAGVCAGEFPEHYMVYFETDYNTVRCPVFVTNLLETDSNHCTLSFDIDVEDIRNCVYNITVEMINGAGRTNSSGSITLCKGLHLYYSKDSYCDLKSQGVQEVVSVFQTDWLDPSTAISLNGPQQTSVAHGSHSTGIQY